MQAQNYSKKELRQFGILVGGVIFLIGAVRWYKHLGYFSMLIYGGLFAVCGLLFPRFLSVFYMCWMRLAEVLEFVSTRVLLGALFFLVFVPINCILIIFKKQTLHTRIDKKVDSYYNPRNIQNSKFFERMF